MIDYKAFEKNSPCAYADGLDLDQFIDNKIKELWHPIPRVAGPAFTVQLSAGDNLMFHASIYEAPPGSIIVATGCGNKHAVAGGNVCAVAQKRGIVGFIIDGVIRDVEEIRKTRFPVFARGLSAKPGSKNEKLDLNVPIKCGGVWVKPGDIIIADEEGIAVVPFNQKDIVLEKANARTLREESTSLEDWEENHRTKIQKLLNK